VTTSKVEAELKGHTGRVTSVTFSQDGNQVISGSVDNTIRIWKVTTHKVEAELQGHTGEAMSVAFSQEGNQVVSGSFDKTVWIWNVMTEKVEAKKDSSQVVSVMGDNTVYI
jgi:WD40 repeat protein